MTNKSDIKEFAYGRVARSDFFGKEVLVLRDLPEGIEPPVQEAYLDEMVGLFLRAFVKVYDDGDFSKEDRAKLVRYLNKIFEAKDAVSCKEPEGGFYKRQP